MYYLKYKDRLTNLGSMHYRAKGEFRLVLMTDTGIVIQDTGWFDNLFLDNGIYNVGFENWSDSMAIGDGTATPQVTDLNLQNQLAQVGASLYSEVNGGTPNYEVITTLKGRFNAGVGTGTINEVGIRKSSTFYGGNLDLSFRTLVVPGIVKAANQVLDVYWKLTVTPDLTPQSGTFTWDGVLYNYRTAPGTMHLGDNLTWKRWGETSYTWWYTTGANIDTGITSRPSGTAEFFSGLTDSDISYSAGQRDVRYSIPLQSTTKYIQAAQFDMTTRRTSQSDQGLKVLFERASDNAPLEILNTEIAYFDMRWTWGR
jgi:hypothetical protein